MAKVEVKRWYGLSRGTYAEKKEYQKHDRAYYIKVSRGIGDMVMRRNMVSTPETIMKNINGFDDVELKWSADKLFTNDARRVKIYVDFSEVKDEGYKMEFEQELEKAIKEVFYPPTPAATVEQAE